MHLHIYLSKKSNIEKKRVNVAFMIVVLCTQVMKPIPFCSNSCKFYVIKCSFESERRNQNHPFNMKKI